IYTSILLFGYGMSQEDRNIINIISNIDKLDSIHTPTVLKINDIYKITKNYVNIINSDILKDFNNNLEKKIQLNNELEGCNSSKIYENKVLEENKTMFLKSYDCFNCFFPLEVKSSNKKLSSKYNGNRHPYSGGIKVKELSDIVSKIIKTDIKRNLVYVDAVEFSNFKNFKNYWGDYSTHNEWYEEIKDISKKQKNNIRYIFLFGRQYDSFNKEYFIFQGLYRFKEFNKEKNCNIWVKCNKSKLVSFEEDEFKKMVLKIESSII
ncbi:MAG: hypothetical protein Q4E75_04275, partial [bacterium]|nr:hypothetical protein [bacterium]